MDGQLLGNKQHGFISCRSILTKLLDCQARISDILAEDQSYDVLSFDFANVFDKAHHQCAIDVIAALGIYGVSLAWYVSKFSDPSLCVRASDSLFVFTDIISGFIQISVLVPILNDIFVDLLLRVIMMPSQAFPDDFKFIANLMHSEEDVQAVANVVAAWANAHGTPLSIEKSFVVHCGCRQPKKEFHINSLCIKYVDRAVTLILCGLMMDPVQSIAMPLSQKQLKKLEPAACCSTFFVSRIINFCGRITCGLFCYSIQAWNPFLKRDVGMLLR